MNLAPTPYKYHTSTQATQVPESAILHYLAEKAMGLKELMEKTGLKNRSHFLTRYITPALQRGVIELLYPESPRHPRQKYRLTAKGRAML